LQICQGSKLKSSRCRCGRSKRSLEFCRSWKSKAFLTVKVELAESMRSRHGKYDLIWRRSEKKPRHRIKMETKLLIWNFCWKIKYFILSGFSWLGAVIQAVGKALGDFPSSSWGWTEFSEILILGLVSSWSIRFSKLCISESLATEILKAGINNKDLKSFWQTLSRDLSDLEWKNLRCDRDKNRHTF